MGDCDGGRMGAFIENETWNLVQKPANVNRHVQMGLSNQKKVDGIIDW